MISVIKLLKIELLLLIIKRLLENNTASIAFHFGTDNYCNMCIDDLDIAPIVFITITVKFLSPDL